MNQMFFNNLLTKEQKEMVKNAIFSFFDGENDDFFKGRISIENEIEDRSEYEYSAHPKLIITERRLKIDVTKTNARLLMEARQEADRINEDG